MKRIPINFLFKHEVGIHIFGTFTSCPSISDAGAYKIYSSAVNVDTWIDLLNKSDSFGRASVPLILRTSALRSRRSFLTLSTRLAFFMSQCLRGRSVPFDGLHGDSHSPLLLPISPCGRPLGCAFCKCASDGRRFCALDTLLQFLHHRWSAFWYLPPYLCISFPFRGSFYASSDDLAVSTHFATWHLHCLSRLFWFCFDVVLWDSSVVTLSHR